MPEKLCRNPSNCRGLLTAFLLAVACAAACHILAGATPAVAQSASVGIYSDVNGSVCSLSDNSPGLKNGYVVVRPGPQGVSGVQFAAPLPSCFTGSYVGDLGAPGTLAVGNSQTGVSIAVTNCSVYPTHVLTIQYYGLGTTPACCPYPVIADPAVGEISVTNCFFATETAAGVVSSFNANASCQCTGNSAPGRPESPAPPDHSTDQMRTPLMSWIASDFDNNIAEYDLYLGTTPSPPLVAAGLTQPSYTPAMLDTLTQYYWRVVVRDAQGLEASSEMWTFKTRALNTPPYPPMNPLPFDEATDRPVNQSLTWVGIDLDEDSLVYDVYFGTSATPPLVAADVLVTMFTPGSLSYGTTYYWRVVAREPFGRETSGPVWSFTTRPLSYPPFSPQDPSPPTNATGQPVNITLSWKGNDPEGDPLLFDVYLGTTTSPPLVASNVPVMYYAPATLNFSTVYYWKVVAKDDHGGVTSGALWKFTTKPENYPPAVPSSPTPSNGQTNRPVTSTLAWQCSDADGDAIVYDVYFGTAATPPLVASSVATKSYAPGPLAFSTTYRWRIVAHDARGAVTSGPTWSFTTKANSAPNAPSNPSPANNGASSLNPTLTWTATDADGQPLTFNVSFGTVSPPPQVATGLTTPGYAPGALQAGTTYYWRVSSSDGLLTTNGPTWNFIPSIPGDVNLDGQVTAADADCALQIFLGDASCGGSTGSARADVNCSGSVTPRDARCIHKKVVDGSCSFCGVSAQAPPEPLFVPHVSAADVWSSGGTIHVLLYVSGVPSLEAFGIFLYFPPGMDLLPPVRNDATSGFVALDAVQSVPFSAVGGYSLSGASALSTVGLVELQFVANGAGGDLYIGGYVDDLAGANELFIHLGDGGGSVPTLITRFDASAARTGVELSWELSSDDVIETLTLLRREGAAQVPTEVGNGSIDTQTRSYLDAAVEPGNTYHYELLVRTRDGNTIRSPVASATTAALGFTLYQNQPNPFNPQTTIRYDIPGASHVRLVILDIAGRIIRALVDDTQPGGTHEAVWNGRDDRGAGVSSGVYFYVLDAGGARQTRKLVLLK